MQITKLEIKDFGKFTGNKVIEDMDTKIVLLYGMNEAGKTTIFNLLKSALYGFFPAQAQYHPYSSWENGRIEFTTYLKTASCDEAIVYRKLLTRPQGKYIVGEDFIDIKNEPLPISKHVSPEIYNKIYSLQVEDLTQIQGKAWEEVEDKLLAGYGTSVIRSTRDVLKNLRVEHEKIWRESGRGKYLVKELEEEIRELRKLKKEAFTREEEIRGADNRIDNIDIDLKKLKEKKIFIKTLLSKSKELNPIKKKLEQLEELGKKLINEEIALTLPQDIRERKRENVSELKDIREKINNKQQLLEKKISERYILSERDKVILENKANINSFAKMLPRIEALKENISKAKYNRRKVKDRIIHEADNFLAEKWDDRIQFRFKVLNKSELKIIVSKYRNTANELHEAKLKRDVKTTHEVNLSPSKIYIISLVFALVCAGAGLATDISALKIVGLGAFIYGLTGMLNYINLKKTLERNRERNGLGELRNRVRELEKKLEIDKGNLMNYLAGIPISDLMIDNMDDMFVVGLLKIKDMVYEFGELERDLDTYEGEYEKEKMKLDNFLNQFSFESFINEDEKIFVLRDSLGELEKKILLDENSTKEIIELKKEISSLREEEKQIEGIVQNYRERLSEIGEGNIEEALNIVEHNYSLKTKIDTLMDEMNERSDIDILVKEIKVYEEENGWIFQDYEVLKAEDELEDINHGINELAVEKARLEENISKLSDGISLDEIESRLNILEEDLQRATMKRDRLALLSEVIRFADQKFKEENQPDVLKNAGKYFSIITNGKYTDIFIDEDDEGNAIMVKEPGKNIPKKVSETFSKGTLNQLYLALRLSLIDYLDRDKEALPICFDELLINWDDQRLDSSLRLLQEISERRQIFIFTCHDWMAEKVEKFFNTKRIAL
ncbi:AAA family ATPase [Wukongibacter baidiensis]|uniref:AAA family ATPase n=1 Tax=Wukongibacter baidiensis TaxID=1723361 RepID=UPI003D7F8FFE